MKKLILTAVIAIAAVTAHGQKVCHSVDRAKISKTSDSLNMVVEGIIYSVGAYGVGFYRTSFDTLKVTHKGGVWLISSTQSVFSYRTEDQEQVEDVLFSLMLAKYNPNISLCDLYDYRLNSAMRGVFFHNK